MSDAEFTIVEKLTVRPEAENIEQRHSNELIDIVIGAWPDAPIRGSVRQYNFEDLFFSRETQSVPRQPTLYLELTRQ